MTDSVTPPGDTVTPPEDTVTPLEDESPPPPLSADTAGAEQLPTEVLDPAHAHLVDALLASAGVTERPDLYRAIFATVALLAAEHTEPIDLKLAAAALAEMAEAFRVFRPYRNALKVTFFGSARTLPEDPLYVQTRRLAERMASHGWMVVTGAGPGIMAAGMEGAGREMSIGVNIRLPHEQGANPFIAQDPKLVEMRYFFTRKLAFIKEADGFVLLPGGFGTLDEAFELLTLVQTGKAQPGPIVLLDVPGGTYWKHWRTFVESELASRGYVSEHDLDTVLITDDVDAAVEEVVGFFTNYHSQRFVDGRLILRLHHAPDDALLATLSEGFADIIARGGIERIDATPAEREGDDHLDLERIALWFDRHGWARLHLLIDRLNRLAA